MQNTEWRAFQWKFSLHYLRIDRIQLLFASLIDGLFVLFRIFEPLVINLMISILSAIFKYFQRQSLAIIAQIRHSLRLRSDLHCQHLRDVLLAPLVVTFGVG